ncbi:DUF2786 domain-containing protein [Lentisphaera profundi]|uniref:DUF2786 domain-containing protein n=1 Tax=Lentisphaera profundi TaxID=1658616 RepID=A0ABY7VY25_9BACT|nr:DUF2786 domain-containing protein [Lentisphaera profundi]WDE99075.1 DUF2786 domain-containing protein [Lentisphaera profundi]
MSNIHDKQDSYRAWYLRLRQCASQTLQVYTLECPTISISPDLSKTLGKWIHSKNEICLAEDIFIHFPWSQVILIFKHELAHMIADLVYDGQNESAHGESFQRVCTELNISAEASMRSPQKQSSLNDKINKLLALSKSSNSHEAQTAASKAQELTDKYNLTPHKHEFSFRSIGSGFKRCPLWHSQIINICSRYFYVKALKNYSSLEKLYFFEIYGEVQNLDTAEYIYNFLYHQGQELWFQNKQAGQRRESFLLGLYEGFQERFKANKNASENSLIHLRNPALQSFFDKLNPRTRPVSYRYKADQSLYQKGKLIGQQLNAPKALKIKKAQKRLN